MKCNCTLLSGLGYLFILANVISHLDFKIDLFVITIKGIEPAISCVRDQDATTVPARHM